MTNFTELAWKKIDYIYNSILKMQFIQELENGSLATEKFKHYIIQDAIYLGEYSRTLALISAKAPTSQLQLQFLRYAQDAIAQRQPLADRSGKSITRRLFHSI